MSALCDVELTVTLLICRSYVVKRSTRYHHRLFMRKEVKSWTSMALQPQPKKPFNCNQTTILDRQQLHPPPKQLDVRRRMEDLLQQVQQLPQQQQQQRFLVRGHLQQVLDPRQVAELPLQARFGGYIATSNLLTILGNYHLLMIRFRVGLRTHVHTNMLIHQHLNTGVNSSLPICPPSYDMPTLCACRQLFSCCWTAASVPAATTEHAHVSWLSVCLHQFTVPLCGFTC